MQSNQQGGGQSTGLAAPAGDSQPPAPPGRRRLHPFFRDLSITVSAQVATAIGGLVLYRLLAERTGTEGFASYSLIKQAAGFFFPIVTVGLVAGLPRYIALPRDAKSPLTESYLGAALLICGAASVLASAVTLVSPSTTAAIFFGHSDRVDLVGPFVATMVATNLFYIAYGYFRGQMRIAAGSALQVAGPVILPSAIVLVFSGSSIATLVYLMAFGLAALSLAVIARPAVRSVVDRRRRRRIAPATRSLFDYGHRRIPGELAQLGLFVFVPILGSHVASLTDVAYLTAGQQALSILGMAVLPIGLILLPTLTRMLAEDREQASRYVAQLSAFAAHVAIFASFQVLLFADVAVEIWLGPQFDDAGDVVRLTVAPAALWVVFLTLRSTLDAAEVRSYNSRNNLLALAVFAICAAFALGFDVLEPVMCVALAFAVGVAAQGGLTFITVHRLFHVRWRDYAFQVAVPAGIVTGALGLAARPAIEDSAFVLPLLILLELVLAAGFFLVVAHFGAQWPRLLADRLFHRSG